MCALAHVCMYRPISNGVVFFSSLGIDPSMVDLRFELSYLEVGALSFGISALFSPVKLLRRRRATYTYVHIYTVKKNLRTSSSCINTTTPGRQGH